MHSVQQIQASQFSTEVLQSRQPVVVDFFATWCPPCRAIAPVLENLAQGYQGQVKFVKVDVEQAPELASRFRIQGVPTLMFFKDGAVIDQVVGAPPAPALQARVARMADPRQRVTATA